MTALSSFTKKIALSFILMRCVFGHAQQSRYDSITPIGLEKLTSSQIYISEDVIISGQEHLYTSEITTTVKRKAKTERRSLAQTKQRETEFKEKRPKKNTAENTPQYIIANKPFNGCFQNITTKEICATRSTNDYQNGIVSIWQDLSKIAILQKSSLWFQSYKSTKKTETNSHSIRPPPMDYPA